MNEKELSKAAYGRYKGVSAPMVTKWGQDGRLVMSEDGKRVKVAESDERIKNTKHLNNYANELAAKAAKDDLEKRMAESTIEELADEVQGTQLDLETTDVDELFRNSRALREKAAALKAAAEHEKYIGKLVSKDVAEKIMFERARACRDALMTSSRRMAPLIAGKTDISEIEKMLSDEYRSLLEQFAKFPLFNDD